MCSSDLDDAGFHVIRAARQQTYNPATALLTAYPPRNLDWKHDGVQSLLVKPIGTQDLLRQIEALLVQQQDAKQSRELARISADERGLPSAKDAPVERQEKAS